MSDPTLEARLADLKAKQAKLDEAWKKTSNKPLLEFFVEIIPRTLDAERCSIFVLDNDLKNVWVMCGTGLKERQICVPRENSLVGDVISTGVARIESDMDQQVGAHEWTDSQTGFETRSAVCVPVRSLTSKKVTGAIQVLNKKGIGVFTLDDQQILEKLAFQIQSNIESIFMQQQTVKLLTEMQKAIAAMEKQLKAR